MVNIKVGKSGAKFKPLSPGFQHMYQMATGLFTAAREF